MARVPRLGGAWERWQMRQRRGTTYRREAKDSIVKCRACGNAWAVSFGACLQSGWPKCCAVTMELQTRPSQKTIDAAVKALMPPVAR